MNKYKKLLSNIGLMTISSFGSKILAFILIPLYTNVLTTAQYGTYDLYLTCILLLSPVLSLNIADSVMRFSFDDKNEKQDIFTVGVYRIFIAITIFAFMILVNYIFNLIPVFNQYPLFLFLYFAFGLTYDLLTQYAKGCDKIKDFAIAGFVNATTVLLLNILFLLVFKIGIVGYFLANIFGFIIPVVYLSVHIKSYKMLRFKLHNKSIKKSMESYSKPIILNTIGWWINNVSDRYIITYVLGLSATGIYSVAYKIPSIINMLQNIFSQAWAISAIKEFDEKNQKFYSQVYGAYNASLVFLSSALIIFDKIIAKILFAKEFYLAWQYAPFLIISVVFGSLSGMLGGIFSAAKNSKTLAKTTVVGAIINIILNFVLINKIGTIGAAVATMVSYCIIWVIRFFEANKVIKLKVNIFRDIIAYFLLIFQSVALIYLNNITISYVIQFAIIICITVIFRKDIKYAINILKEKILSKKIGNK